MDWRGRCMWSFWTGFVKIGVGRDKNCNIAEIWIILIRGCHYQTFNQVKKHPWAWKVSDYILASVSSGQTWRLRRGRSPCFQAISLLFSFFFSEDDASQFIWDYHDTVEKARTINTVIKKKKKKKRMSDSMLFFYLSAALRHTGGDLFSASLILRVWLHFQGRKSHYEKWLREKPRPRCSRPRCSGTLWASPRPLGRVEVCNVSLGGKFINGETAGRSHVCSARWNCVFISSCDPAVKSLCYVKCNLPETSVCTLAIHLVSAHLASRARLSTHLSIHPSVSLSPAPLICCRAIISQVPPRQDRVFYLNQAFSISEFPA